MNLRGHLYLVHRDPGGNIRAAWETDNLIVNDGLAAVATRLAGGALLVDGMVLSTNANPVTPADKYTDMLGLSVPFDSLTSSGATVTAVATFPGTPPYITYQSVGLVRAGISPEILLARALTGAVTLYDNDTLTVTWEITITP
jgi:hypothetical protein